MPTLNPPHAPAPWADAPLTARLVLADGTVIAGTGLGATGSAVGEVCFNTAMTGYQEILTDPSYAGQIITFTFPHIGNVATTGVDTRALTARIREQGMPNGVIAHEPSGIFDIDKLKAEAKAWPGLDGMDLV